jgi:hypothetical protein
MANREGEGGRGVKKGEGKGDVGKVEKRIVRIGEGNEEKDMDTKHGHGHAAWT